MVEVRETELPGVGVCHEFVTRSGNRIGVVLHHTGDREIFLCPPGEPDATAEAAVLDEEESSVLADVLGAPRIAQGQPLGSREPQLIVEPAVVRPGSRYVGWTIGRLTAVATPGVTVAAVLRAGVTIPAPGVDQELRSEDTIVLVGASAAVSDALELLVSD